MTKLEIAVKEINTLKTELREIKDLLKDAIKNNALVRNVPTSSTITRALEQPLIVQKTDVVTKQV